MKDDSLNDTQRGADKMQDATGGYCPMCDTVWALPGKCRCNPRLQELKDKVAQSEKLSYDPSFKIAGYKIAQTKAKPESVGKIDNVPVYTDTDYRRMEIDSWNAAIDAAIAELDIINDIGGAFLVRKLKK